MNRRTVTVAALAVAALACATDRPRRSRTVGSPATEGLPDSELVCTVDYDTGSNIPTRYCRTKAEAQADRDEALNMPFRPVLAPPPAEVQGAQRRGGSGG